jgi:hypothetical protein
MALTENQIIEAIAQHLISQGWTIDQKLTTNQRGTDIIASRDQSPRLLIEAKGGTSSKDHTNRYGMGFSNGQVTKHVSVAFYYAAKLQELHPSDVIGIGLPDDAPHRAAVAAIESAVRKLAISVYFVSDSADVCEWK